MAYKSKFMKEREKESAQNQASEASSSVSVRSDSAGVSGAQFKSKFFQAGGHVNPSAVAPAKSNWAVPEKAEEQKKRANTGNVTADILADSGADWLSKQFSFERSMDMENQAFGSPVWRKKYGAMPDAEQRKAVQDLQDKHKFLTAKGYSEDASKVQEELDWLYTYGGSSAQAAGRKAERSRNETRIVLLDNDIQALYDELNTGLGAETASGAPSMDPVRQKIRELEDERNKLRTQNAQYDRTYGVMDSYQPVRTADDFGYLSAVRPLRNPSRDKLLEIDAAGADIPFIDRLGLFLGASELEKEQAMAVPYDQEGTWETILKDGFDGSWDMLEQDEIQVYYYLLNKYGTEKADQYLADMKPELNRRSTAERAKFIDNASGMQKLALNVASVPASIFGGIPAYMEDAAALLQGKDINPYSSAHAMSNEAQATRASTAQKIDKKTGNASLLGVTFGDAYQAVMSGADSLFGGGFLGAAGYGLAMGMGSASTKARELYEQGATNEQIAAGSLLAGAAEMVFEKYSIEKLFELKDAKTVLHVVKNALIQGGVEASEETFTEIANTITDAIVRGNQSDWSRSIRGYMEDGKSEEEATALALLDVGMNVWKAAAGGFISGTLMGGTATAINYAGSRTDSKQNTKNQNDPILAAAMEIAGAETSQNRQTSSEVKEDTRNEKPAQAMAQTATEAETAVQTQEQDRWNQAADRAFGETGQKAFRTVNDGSLDPADLYAGFAVYHHAGMMGRDINTITSPYAVNFPENYRKIAYDAGVADSASSVKARTDAAATATVYGEDAGVIANDYSKSMDQNVVQTLDSVAKSIGRKVIVEDLGSETNGFVDSDGVIHLDIHAENPHLVVAAHEITHVMEDLAPAEHKRYRDYVMNALADANGGSVLGLVEAQKEAYAGKQKLSDEQAMNELVADYTKRMMENKDLFSDFAKKDRTAAQKLLDAIKKFLEKVKSVFNGNRQAQNEAAQREFGMDISMVEEAAKLWQDALTASQTQAQAANKNTAQQDGGQKRHNIKGTAFTEDKYFSRQIDKWDELSNGSRIKVGIVREGSALNQVGLPAAGMYFDVGKIRTAMGEHADHLIPGILKGVPDLLNDPIVITEYRGPNGDIDNTVNVYGNLFLPNSNTPVVVGVVMHLDRSGQNVITNIRTIHARSNFAKQITDDTVLYLNEDKKKTRNWFQVCGNLNVPLEGTKFGLIRSIPFIRRDGNRHSAKTPVEGATLQENKDGVVAKADGTPVAATYDNGSSRLSLKTYKEGGRSFYEEYLEKQVKNKNLTAAEAADMLQQLDAIYDICNGYRNKYVPFSAWSDAAVQVDSKGNPVFSVIKKNGEYSMNLDFSLVCKKRRTLDGVFNLMVKNGMIDKIAMGEADIVKINDIIRSHGFETACALCFVDAKRFRQANVALQFADVYNDMVKSMIPEGSNLKVGYHNFGGNTYLPNVTGGIDTMADSALDMTHINEVLAGAPKKKANWTVEHKVADYLKRNPADRKLVDVGDFMSTAGFEQVQKTKPGIMGLYNAKKGIGGPKAAFGDVQYLNDILKRSTAFNAKKAYAIGGVRVQSFSDYVPRMVFDYVQMISELAAKKLPAHAYTKEPLFAMQYGMTGMKINLSLIPKVVDGGIAPGLDANGNYVWADESFPYDVAVQIQNANGYSANCGTICVGVSDEHIRTLMADDSIRMVIPYHKSGLNHIVASMNKIDQFEDYTNVQNTRYADSGTKLSKADANKETGYNERLREIGDPRKAAEAYVRWCEENNYLPKFDKFAYMQIDGEYVVDDEGKRVVDENYYKLLEDFTGYDNGIYAPQGAVTMTFPQEGDAFGSMAELIEQGLEEDAILEAKRTEKLPEIVREIGEAFGVERNAAETSDVSASEEAAELSDTNIRYSLRKKDPPKKTGVAYKVFLAKDGQLYPPMVANPGGEGTPVGVWLDADIGKSAPPSKTGRPQVQGGGKGTNSGKISLAFRPGWHLGDIPLAKQFAQLNPDTGKKELFPANFVWAECEYAMDEDYQEEAMSYGYTENGKFRHSYAGLPRLPEDGYYRYRTNPNPDTVPWIITGAMRVKRILTDAETDAICRENGVEPMARKGGPIDLEKFGLSAGDVVEDQEGRYSRKGGSVVDAAAARAEDVEALKSQLAHWKSQVKLTKGFKVDSKDVESMAKKLIRTYQADTDSKALAQKLQELYDGIASGYYGNKEIDFETAKARSEEIAKTIVENAVETENEMYVEYAELRKYLRGVTLNISAEDSHDIPGFNDFRKRNFGRMRIGSDGTNIDTVYKELSTLWPEFFDEQQETTPSDQLLQIAEVMEAVYRTQEVNPFVRYAEEAVSDIADEVMANFFTLPQAQTFADKAAAKLKQATADARLAGQMSQGRQDAKQLRKANEQIDLLKVQLKQAKADASKLKQTSAKDAPKLQKANEKVAELEAKLKQATADARLAGQMAQGRMDAALLRRSEERAARAQERAKAALAQEKKRGADAVQKLKDSQAAKTAKSREQRKAAELRGKIIRHSRDMSQKLLRPTDKKHVPEELQSAVAAVLNAINLESNYEVEYGTDAKFHHVKPGESPYSEATNRTKAFQQLREAYKKLAGEVVIDPAVISGDGDQAAAGPLLQAVLDMGDIRIVDMNSAQLDTVWRVLKAVEQSVSKANKLFLSAKYETISDMASQLESHSVFRKPKKAIKAPKFLGGSCNLTLDLEIPLTFFSQYGDVGEAIYQELRDAQDYQERLTDQLADEVGEIVKPKQVQQLQKEVHTLHTEEGIELKLTTAHIMELYELSKRKQAEDHLLKGGIVQPEIESAKVERGTDMIKLSANDLGEIISKLTPEQKQIADSLQKLLTTTLADAGNRASMQAYGYKKFTGTDYWPIKSAQESLHSKVEKNANNTRSIKNIGLAQQVVPHANTALNLNGIFQTFAGHATDMIDYASWLCPMEDANRLFNYKYKDAMGIPTGKTVKGLLDRVGGSGSQAYWSNLMEDIQNGIGGPGDSAFAGIAARITGNVKGASVGANIRVVAQQPTAIFRAATVLSPANLSKGMANGVTKGNGWKKALEHSDIAKRKDRGGFEISNPMQMSEILYDDKSGLARFNDAMSWAAAKADSVTWGKIWNACEWQVHDQNKALTPGSEAFYQQTAKLFADVINQSQVVDGVMQRSQIMRSSNQISKQMTSFMGEPTMSLNMLMRAYDAIRYEKDPPKRGKAMKQAARVAGALLVTDVMTALAQSLIDGLRDDDRDKGYWQRVWSALTGVTGEEESAWDKAVGVVLSGNLVSTMNPIGRLPYAKDLLSLIQGYSVERMDISAFSDLIEAGTTFVDSVNGEGTKTWAYATKQLATAGSKVLGISAANILRDVWSIARSIAIETGNLPLQYEMEKAIYKIGNEKNDNRYIDILYDAMNSDQEVYRTIYADMVKNGVSADKISKGIEKRMKKDQGVTSVEELTSRYLTPDQEKVYREAYDRVTGTRVWKAATEDQREKLEDNLYDLTVCNDAGEELREKIDSGKSVGIDEVEYLLYKLAQEVVSEDGNKNTSQSEAEAAAAMLTGLSKAERAWLWQSTNKGWNDKNNPFK